MAVKRGARTATGDVSILPVLGAVAAGKVDATMAWRAWERRERDRLPMAVALGVVVKERPERTPETFSAPPLHIWAERFAVFEDRLPNLADDKDREALRSLGYAGGWS